MSSWTPRLTNSGIGYPNPYWWDSNINPNANTSYCLANCTTYAYGRILEAGDPAPVSVIRNANHWHEVLTNGWTYTNYDPDFVEAGDILEYAYGTNNHVAVVEKVENGIITLSQSGFKSRNTSWSLQQISNYMETTYPTSWFNLIWNWGGRPTYILKNPAHHGGGGPSPDPEPTKTLPIWMMIPLKKRRGGGV